MHVWLEVLLLTEYLTEMYVLCGFFCSCKRISPAKQRPTAVLHKSMQIFLIALSTFLVKPEKYVKKKPKSFIAEA